MSQILQEAPEHLQTQFSVRRDHNGLRVVYNLGNELGDCPFRCTFCSVGQSPLVTTAWNLEEFERQHEGYLQVIDGIYHPLIYNQGNVTNPPEFSRSTLFHILQVFAQDSRVAFVSLNSRACHARRGLLEEVLALELPYPVHFIFGVESTSPRAAAIFGKDTTGELEEFFQKLAPYDDSEKYRQPARGYNFGLDLNLVFLPELYLEPGEPRVGNEARIVEGMRQELQRLLDALDPAVPAEINLHPYHRVERLEYEDLDLKMFIDQLPLLRKVLEEHNESFPGWPSHLFVGVEGSGFDSVAQQESVAQWKAKIDRFNREDRSPK